MARLDDGSALCARREGEDDGDDEDAEGDGHNGDAEDDEDDATSESLDQDECNELLATNGLFDFSEAGRKRRAMILKQQKLNAEKKQKTVKIDKERFGKMFDKKSEFNTIGKFDKTGNSTIR